MSPGRLRTELRDLLELVLLPGLAAVLPWALCFRVFRYLCRAEFLYREACEAAATEARARGWLRNGGASWRQRHRLVTLIDHADFYLELTRSNRWMARHLQVEGVWPEASRPGIFCTFHWGAGMWALRHLRNNEFKVHLLIAPHARASFPGRSVRYWYYRQRIRAIPRALGREPIEATSTPRRVLQALRSSEQVAAVVDVPADQVAASLTIDFLGQPVRVPRGLLRMACDGGIPVTVYLLGIRLSDGKRLLRIHPLGARSEVEPLAREVFAFLETAIAEEPAAWHFWSIAPRFFGTAES